MKPKLRLHLHAGVGKTGTTAIQRLLTDNPEALTQAGYLYVGLFFEQFDPGLKGEPPAARFGSAIRGDQEELSRMVGHYLNLAEEHCHSHGLTDIIWSNEGIFNQPRKLGPILSQHLDRFDWRFIIYLRRQDAWFLSAYKQWGIKHKTYTGAVRAFDEWYEGRKPLGRYADMLEQWESTFPIDTIQVRIYEKCPDVKFDFKKVVGLEGAPLEVQAERPYRTPSNTILSLFKLYQSQFQSEQLPNEFQSFLRRTGLTGRKFVPTSPGLDLPNEGRLSEILDEYEEANARLQRYSKPGYEVAFPDSETLSINEEQVGYDHVVPALLYALVRMDQALDQLEQRVSALEGEDDAA